MQRFSAACLALLLVVPVARGGRLVTRRQLAARARGHTLEDVIGMLEGLMKTTKQEGEEEEYEFGKFSHWCKTSDKTLQTAIKEEKAQIDRLSELISAKKEEISVLTSQIAELDEQLLTLDKQDGAASTLRTKEENLYKKSDTDLGDTISAVKSALVTLEDVGAQHTGLLQAKAKVRALVELVQTVATAEQQAVLREFVADDPDLTERPDFEAQGDKALHVKKYEFKSGKVVELLKQLVQKFEADLLAATKAETNAVNAYNLAKSAREDERTAAKKSRDIKDTDKGEAVSDKDKAETKLGQTQGDLKADSDLLADTVQKCETKSAQWAERQKIRGLELQAMQAAIKIIAEVTGVRTEAPENPVPPTSPIFLQVRSRADPRMRAVQLLRTAARATKSQALERFAQEVSAHLAGPFDEVNNMMEKMIHHLMAEQKDEDDHKNWCDLELNKTEASISDKADKMEELLAKTQAAEANVAELTGEISASNDMVAKIDMHMKESAEIREIGKKENAAAIKDAKDAQAALANAIAVLETHYKETTMIPKQPYELVQRHAAPVALPDSPDTWTSSYTGVTDPNNGGIITVLKEVNADFAKMEADTVEQEASDEKFYKDEMSASEVEKATRLKDAEAKGEERKRQVEKAAILTAEHKHVSEEHQATDQYLADLQKACVDGTSDYESRKDARDKEIAALHEAKDILKEAFEKSL